MSRISAAPGAAVPVSSARAAASRRNGAQSGGPKTPGGQGALGAEFAEAAAELPVAPPAPVRAQPSRPAARPVDAYVLEPNELERLIEYVLPAPPVAVRSLHETAAPARALPYRTNVWSAPGPRWRAGWSTSWPTHPGVAAGYTMAAEPCMPNKPEPAPPLQPAPALPVGQGERKMVVR